MSYYKLFEKYILKTPESPFQDPYVDYLYSFDEYLKSANVLLENGLYFSSYLDYFLSAECFMKFIYVVKSKEIFFHNKTQNHGFKYLELIFENEKHKKIFSENLNAKKFGHKLAELHKYIVYFFPQLKNTSIFPSFTSAFKHSYDFSSARYVPPKESEMEAKEKSEMCKKTFVEFINEIYRIMENKN